MRTRRNEWGPWLALVLFAWTSTGVAQEREEAPVAQAPENEEARRHFEVATTAFENGDYAVAVREFQTAYGLAPFAELLFNIYSAAERGGMLEVAADALERYLAEGDPGERRAGLTLRLERLRERIAGAPEERTTSTVEERAEPTNNGGPHPAAIALLVGGGAAFASFGVFAGLALAEDASLASSCGRDATATCSEDRVQSLQTFNVIADVSWIAGAALAATGLVLLFALPAESTGERDVAVAPWADPTGAGVTLRGAL